MKGIIVAFLISVLIWIAAFALYAQCIECTHPIAKRTNVEIVWVEGAFAVWPWQRGFVLKEAQRYLRKLPTRVHFVQRVLKNQLCNFTLKAESDFYSNSLTCFRIFRRSHDRPSIFITPPLIAEDGRRAIAGVADTTCSGRFSPLDSNNQALVYGQSENQLGEPRLLGTAVGVAHELGHLLGASHTADSVLDSVMHPAPLGRAPNIEFKSRSIRQISNCLRRPGWGISSLSIIDEPLLW